MKTSSYWVHKLETCDTKEKMRKLLLQAEKVNCFSVFSGSRPLIVLDIEVVFGSNADDDRVWYDSRGAVVYATNGAPNGKRVNGNTVCLLNQVAAELLVNKQIIYGRCKDVVANSAERMYNPEVVATSKLANVEIAAEDYNIGGKVVDGKHYFTYDEALEVQEKLEDTGWRLPTRSEWVLICEEFGQKDGQLNVETLYKNLNMSYTGYYDYEDGKLYNRTTYGFWWSATRSSATGANLLRTDTSGVSPQRSNYRGNGFAVRLVRDADWGKGANV